MGELHTKLAVVAAWLEEGVLAGFVMSLKYARDRSRVGK